MSQTIIKDGRVVYTGKDLIAKRLAESAASYAAIGREGKAATEASQQADKRVMGEWNRYHSMMATPRSPVQHIGESATKISSRWVPDKHPKSRYNPYAGPLRDKVLTAADIEDRRAELRNRDFPVSPLVQMDRELARDFAQREGESTALKRDNKEYLESLRRNLPRTTKSPVVAIDKAVSAEVEERQRRAARTRIQYRGNVIASARENQEALKASNIGKYFSEEKKMFESVATGAKTKRANEEAVSKGLEKGLPKAFRGGWLNKVIGVGAAYRALDSVIGWASSEHSRAMQTGLKSRGLGVSPSDVRKGEYAAEEVGGSKSDYAKFEGMITDFYGLMMGGKSDLHENLARFGVFIDPSMSREQIKYQIAEGYKRQPNKIFKALYLRQVGIPEALGAQFEQGGEQFRKTLEGQPSASDEAIKDLEESGKQIERFWHNTKEFGSELLYDLSPLTSGKALKNAIRRGEEHGVPPIITSMMTAPHSQMWFAEKFLFKGRKQLFEEYPSERESENLNSSSIIRDTENLMERGKNVLQPASLPPGAIWQFPTSQNGSQGGTTNIYVDAKGAQEDFAQKIADAVSDVVRQQNMNDVIYSSTFV